MQSLQELRSEVSRSDDFRQESRSVQAVGVKVEIKADKSQALDGLVVHEESWTVSRRHRRSEWQDQIYDVMRIKSRLLTLEDETLGFEPLPALACCFLTLPLFTML